ncbi:RyR domain-containing protein [Bacillus sp. m3-13]|uniref:RyR domain-containing protein n=1 Tax=Bacillus sp. m3-13 TaxID=406124 RepID=UPI0001E89CBE|nr:RyR domain-containing protein [Bacillus sp. m3-13]
MTYIPKPIDTSSIKLAEDLEDLTEVLAENTHDLWAMRRMEEGWTYGPERNDIKKEHPGLVPYNELTETEKDYDRATAMESLKIIMALGYEINKK